MAARSLLIGPVAELTRRWLSDPNTFQLELTQPVLADRIYASIRLPMCKRKRSVRSQ